MFLGLPEIAVILLVLLLLEVGLFWAAVSLGDGPEVSWGKTLGVSLLVGAFCLGSTAAIAWGTALLTGRLGLDFWVHATVAALASVAVSWVLSSVLYMPLLPVSAGKSMVISVVQILLRAFLYVLIAAVVFVVLACVQIISARRAEARPGSAVTACADVARPVAA